MNPVRKEYLGNAALAMSAWIVSTTIGALTAISDNCSEMLKSTVSALEAFTMTGISYSVSRFMVYGDSKLDTRKKSILFGSTLPLIEIGRTIYENGLSDIKTLGGYALGTALGLIMAHSTDKYIPPKKGRTPDTSDLEKIFG
ncbi:MAG: hypothetical protein ACP5NS_00955 [Candidatus Pacearchaeota archaeon]